ncbi:protein pafC [Longispora fulva]|uniref:Proteasome accessory factor C n=1 Tax=Longispora fulva TaxID=619741 RepID=A0A8J7KGG5_9ACTN|nr:WYL domain-containing protein [Longispora fulva]MBG6137340.1 proteasome accessory factor C [Longispora fulva]GIG61306.1 protein pafC [Longispora fulva]
MTPSADRLGRLLNLVPYLLARPGILIADAAYDLGVTERQLREDLELLWMCGLPGYGPGDLIDMAVDEDSVTITYDAGIDRPLRLTPDEALALHVALRLLAESPGAMDRDVVHRTLAKIEKVAAAEGFAVRMPDQPERVEDLRRAMDRGRALRITYYTARRDASTERVVDPMRLLLADGRTYLEAWCRSACAVRLFRADRIDALTELEEPSAPPEWAVPTDVAHGVFRPTPELPLVTLRIAREARWVTEYYPCESVTPQPDGDWIVTLRAADLGWAHRLILGLGGRASAVAPPELVASIGDEARTALSAYL